MSKSDASIRIEYADVLSGDEDHAAVELVRDLEMLARTGDPWEALPAVPAAVRPHACPPRGGSGARARWRGLGRLTQLGVLVALALLGVSLTLAAEAITNLGKPTSSTSSDPYFPLSGFHRDGKALRANSRPELLFISAQSDSWSAAERWAVVKALDQFGTLSHVSSSTAPSPIAYSGPNVRVRLPEPTFDLSHATYRSRYLAFVHRDVLDSQNRVYQTLNATEQALYARYARSGIAYGAHDPDHFLGTLNGTDLRTDHRFPLTAVGGYIQTESGVLYPVDFLVSETGSAASTGLPTHYASFDQIQGSLTSNQPMYGLESTMLDHVNAEANIITALICHADGSQPRSVCGRPVIKSLLRHVR